MYSRGELGQVARALRVLDALRGFKHGRWVSEVAAELGASERTVRRDIDELQDAGFDIEVTRRDNRSFACLETERTYSPVSITKRERFTLLAVRSVFDVLQGTPFLDDVRSVMAKLEQRMSDKEQAELAAFGERFVYMPDHGTKSYAGKEDIIDALQTGILSRKVVRYRYADARGRARDGFLAPFGMMLYRHGLYAIGARLKDASATRRPRRSRSSRSNASQKRSTCARTTTWCRRASTFGTRSMARSDHTSQTKQARTKSWSSSARRGHYSPRRVPGTSRNESSNCATVVSGSPCASRISPPSCRGS
jgi:predicted DNA-binding transcriptional regulator YafY